MVSKDNLENENIDNKISWNLVRESKLNFVLKLSKT